jgi:4-hydroxybutyryl-CoA dehydratase/vinylacetyl-CoA-Delta-isomerase
LLRTGDQFLRSLDDGRQVYYRGKKIGDITKHDVLGIAARHAAKLFEIERAYRSDEFGEASLYFRIPRSAADLMERHKLVYDTTMHCNGVFNISQAIGSDALFAMTLVSKKADHALGTEYSKRVREYHQKVATEDLTLAVAQTDVKGDRSKRPHEQKDRDVYVHADGTFDGGIIVSGAKAHTTQSAVADEIIVIPTRSMTEKDSDYSLAFAVPANTPGLRMVVRPIDEVEGNTSNVLSKKDFESETLTMFDKVRVPWERVFLFKEHQYAGPLAVTFATYHRFTAVSYRAATSNLFVGATSLSAKANGIGEAPHIRDNLQLVIMYKELMRMSAIAAAHSCTSEEGQVIPNPLYTNIGKLYSNVNFGRVVEALVDTAGGMISTMPAQEDLEAPDEKNEISKYMTGAVSGEERIKVMRIAKELAASSLTGYLLTLMIHAEGSAQASKLGLVRDYDLSEAERLIHRILADA